MKKKFVAGCIVAVAGTVGLAVFQNNEYQVRLNKIATSATWEKSSLQLDALLHGGLATSFKAQTHQMLCDAMSDAGIGVSKARLRERIEEDAPKNWEMFLRKMELEQKKRKDMITPIENNELEKLSVETKVRDSRNNGNEAFLAAPIWKSDLDVRKDIKRACT